MSTEVFSVRIRKELKEIVKKYNDVNWRKLVEELIEEVATKKELEEKFRELDQVFKNIPPSPEPGWKAVREARNTS